MLVFLLVGIYGYLRCTKGLDAIFRLACALQKAHSGGIRVPIEGHTMKGIRCNYDGYRTRRTPLYFLLLHAFSSSAILNYEATNTGQVGRLQPHCQTRARGVMTKRPVAFFSFSFNLAFCVAWEMNFI